MMRRRLEHASLDRIGLALAAGGLAVGAAATLLRALGEGAAPVALLGFWGLASIVAMPLLAVYAAPIWLAVRRIGLTGPLAAVAAGLGGGLLLGVLTQIDGDMLGAATMRYRWVSAIATGVVIAPISIAVALLMWRIAYRRIG